MNRLSSIHFVALGGWLFHELEQKQAVYDLPVACFFQRADLDVSCSVNGHRASIPFDPAAGPHTQFAANFVWSWPAGCRVIKAKTPIEDELAVPCRYINMRRAGFNVEWSQELNLKQI